MFVIDDGPLVIKERNVESYGACSCLEEGGTRRAWICVEFSLRGTGTFWLSG